MKDEKIITCPYCGEKVVSQTNQGSWTDFWVIFFLIWLAIIPAVIYYGWMRSKKQCPNCLMVFS